MRGIVIIEVEIVVVASSHIGVDIAYHHQPQDHALIVNSILYQVRNIELQSLIRTAECTEVDCILRGTLVSFRSDQTSDYEPTPWIVTGKP